MDEVRSGLPELREVRDDREVRLDQVAIRTAPASAARAAEAAAEAAAGVLLRLERHGQVGADSGEGIQRLVLRLVETVREARDHDHERDAEAEPEERDDRPRTPSYELVAQIAKVEHIAKQISST